MASESRARLMLVVLLLGAAAHPARAELWIGAAASLREVASEVAARYEEMHPGSKLSLTFGASSAIALQVESGARLDVLLSADLRILEELAANGHLVDGKTYPFATNGLVIMTPAESRARIDTPRDLLQPAIRRLAIPGRHVPLGRYALGWLEARGLLADLEPRLVRTEHARATLAAVDLGVVDAAIVYASDARVARSAHVAFSVPADEHEPIVYAAGIVSSSRDPDAARGFLGFLSTHDARNILRTAGLGIVPHLVEPGPP